MNESDLSNLKSEFKLWGVKPHVGYLKSGHIELSWQATPDKPERRYVIPKTGSDWRGWMNARSDIRKLFKADNLQLIEHIKKEAKPKPAIVQALAVPEPIERDADQIKYLRAEVSDLSELLLNMMTMVKELIASMTPAELPPFGPAAPSPAPEPAPVAQAAPVKRRTNTRSIKTVDFISVNWSSTDALARDMGLDRVLTKRKLEYLLKQDVIEVQGDRWRKKPEKPMPMPMVIAKGKKRALNGHHKH